MVNSFNMKNILLRTAVIMGWGVVLCLIGSGIVVADQDPQAEELAPHYGPFQARLGQVAQIEVPEGYLFLNAEDTQAYMRRLGNNASGAELGTIANVDDNWFIIFEFDDIGYVKDTEKDQLDVDAIFQSIKSGNEHANDYRRQQGVPAMEIVGWQQVPTYNPETHNLEWCVRAVSEGREILNHNTRILGRSGVMQVILVVDPDRLSSIQAEVSAILGSYAFVKGEKYAQWKAGDKIAKYGLSALVAGGAAAVLIKTGLLQKLIKPIIVGVVLLGGVIAKFYRRFFFTKGSVSSEDAEPGA